MSTLVHAQTHTGINVNIRGNSDNIMHMYVKSLLLQMLLSVLVSQHMKYKKEKDQRSLR